MKRLLIGLVVVAAAGCAGRELPPFSVLCGLCELCTAPPTVSPTPSPVETPHDEPTPVARLSSWYVNEVQFRADHGAP